jgi:dihydrofolate reductase
MRRIKAAEIVSLDGVVEQPDAWTPQYFDSEVAEVITSSMAASDAMLLGRRTYEEFAAVWPDRGTDSPVGAYMNNTPKFVVSSTLAAADWHNSSVISDHVEERVAKLKTEDGRDINITGSATLVRSLLQYRLLDELQLFVYPVVIGRGRRLFPDGTDQAELRLDSARTFGTGLVMLTYATAAA